MDNDRIDAYRIDDDADDVSVSEPVPPRVMADPIDVVERYYTAYNSGDADAVLRLYATDAVADAEGGGVARSLMHEVIQDEFTDLLSGAIAFEWQIEIRNCVIAEQTEFATSVTCDGIARDITDEILGVAADGVVRLWIDDGLVRRIEEDHDAKELLGLNRFGFFYVDTPEYIEANEAWLAWALERQGEGWDAVCYRNDELFSESECVALAIEAARQYIAETGG